MNRLLMLLTILGLLPAPAAQSQDKADAKAWGEALAYYQRYSTSRDPVERKQAAEAVGEATSEKHDKMAFQLISGILRAELAKEGQNGRTEEKISGEVLEGCLKALKKLSSKDIIAEMTKIGKQKNENPRIRAYMIWGMQEKSD